MSITQIPGKAYHRDLTAHNAEHASIGEASLSPSSPITTASGSVYFGWATGYTVTLSSGSTTVFAGNIGKITFKDGSANITGAGHIVGNLGWAIHDSSRTNPLLIGQEGKIEVLSGTATTAVASENQLTTNAGTIGTLILTDSNIITNAGNITTAVGHRFNVEASAGTITTAIANYVPDLSGIIPGAARWSHKSDDPGALMVNKAAIVDQSTYAATPTTGQTVTIPRGYSTCLIIPAGTLATLTVAFPPASGLEDGYETQLKTTQTLTALTLSSAGATFLDAVTTLTALGYCRYRYIAASTMWYRIG